MTMTVMIWTSHTCMLLTCVQCAHVTKKQKQCREISPECMFREFSLQVAMQCTNFSSTFSIFNFAQQYHNHRTWKHLLEEADVRLILKTPSSYCAIRRVAFLSHTTGNPNGSWKTDHLKDSGGWGSLFGSLSYIIKPKQNTQHVSVEANLQRHGMHFISD